MIIVKALNNNVALVADSKNECVVMGKGVAFGKAIGDEIDPSRIEKKYVLQDDKVKDFDSLMHRVNVDVLELASEIITDGENALGYALSSSILVALSDHLGLVLERAKEDLYFGTPLEWDIKLIYPKEYKVSLKAVEKINKLKNLQIPEQEAAFIALHFINANMNNSEMHETVFMTKIIQNILNIVRIYYGRDFKEDDFEVSRFITHIRYFVKRQVNGIELTGNLEISETIFNKCPKDYICAKRINAFLKAKYEWDITTSELMYLTLHLNRIGQTN